MHSSFESLCEAVPIKYLPKDYGGENGSIKEVVARTEQLVLDYREYLLDEKNYGVDEKLRIDGPSNVGAQLGIDGSFRMLNVD